MSKSSLNLSPSDVTEKTLVLPKYIMDLFPNEISSYKRSMATLGIKVNVIENKPVPTTQEKHE